MNTISLVVVVFAAPVSASERPRLRATRVDRAPAMDPTLADGIWSLAQASDQFTQKFPTEGQPPVEPTTVRVVYDREALYVRFDCEQRLARVVQRLTRRGRLVESDWVSIGLGTRRDGKSAFEFLVNASGVLVDTLRYNDTDTAGSWDENWEARAALTPVGWSAVFKIPLRILRFEELPLQSWDLQARRYVSERQETDEWAFIPRSLGGEVSHYGKLDGLERLRRGTQIELLPFVLGRFRRRDAVSGQLASGTDWSGSAGLNLKWHPTQALTLDLAINPDFGQVDPDQLVLNLTQFETYYPEQRPFFNEGIDTFATPMQLLYTRRIGRAPSSPTLHTNQPFGEQLVDVPEPDAIYGAAKLTGRMANRWTIGFLEAVTGRNNVDVQSLDGVRARRLVDPLTSFTVLRLKRDLGSNAEIGLTTTAKVADEPVGTYPWLPPTATAPALQLCPSGLLVSLPSRCFNNSYVGSADWRWRSLGGAWVTGGQAAMSLLDQGPPRYVRDGTVLRPGEPGFAVVTYLNKEGGEHWVGDVGFEFDDRKFDANDLGCDVAVPDRDPGATDARP